MTAIHWPSVLAAAALVVAFLLFFPAPVGCGCARRKRALNKWADELFGDDGA